MASDKWPLPPQDPRDSGDPRDPRPRGRPRAAGYADRQRGDPGYDEFGARDSRDARPFDPRQEYGDPGNGDPQRGESRHGRRPRDPRYPDHPPSQQRLGDPRLSTGHPSSSAEANSDPWDLAGLTRPTSERRNSGSLRALEPPRQLEPMPPTARLVAPGQLDAAASRRPLPQLPPGGQPSNAAQPPQIAQPPQVTQPPQVAQAPAPPRLPTASPAPVAEQVRTVDQPRRSGENTRSVHLPAALADPAGRPGYCAMENPAVATFCAAVASLEGVNLSYQVTAQAFASVRPRSQRSSGPSPGPARTSSPRAAVYGGTYGFLRNVAANFGVQTDFVDMTDLRAGQAALRPGALPSCTPRRWPTRRWPSPTCPIWPGSRIRQARCSSSTPRWPRR